MDETRTDGSGPELSLRDGEPRAARTGYGAPELARVSNRETELT
jgi:hypothetical protein